MKYLQAIEVLHQHPKLTSGSYDYQCGFLDALKLAKELARDADKREAQGTDTKTPITRHFPYHPVMTSEGVALPEPVEVADTPTLNELVQQITPENKPDDAWAVEVTDAQKLCPETLRWAAQFILNNGSLLRDEYIQNYMRGAYYDLHTKAREIENGR